MMYCTSHMTDGQQSQMLDTSTEMNCNQFYYNYHIIMSVLQCEVNHLENAVNSLILMLMRHLN